MDGVSVEVIGSLIATLIITLSIYIYGKIKLNISAQLSKIEGRQSAQLDKLLHPISEYRDISCLATSLLEALEAYEKDYSRAIILRALPCELTSVLTDNINEASDNVNKNLRNIEFIINEIISQGNNDIGGIWDKSLFGKTGIKSIDDETKKHIYNVYFGYRPPPTSSLALHNNFNEIGIILLGKTKTATSKEVSEWKYGFLLFFSNKFDKFMGGFRFNNHSHIEPLEEIFKLKYKEAEYHHSFSSNPEDNQEFFIAFEKFYSEKV